MIFTDVGLIEDHPWGTVTLGRFATGFAIGEVRLARYSRVFAVGGPSSSASMQLSIGSQPLQIEPLAGRIRRAGAPDVAALDRP